MLAATFMNIQTALTGYRNEANFFAPDYERENEVLSKFCSLHTSLSSGEIEELSYILENADNWYDKYFVADLLYLYNPIPEELLEPMLMTAIKYKDPSFNRIFLTPCIRSFGLEKITESLRAKKRRSSSSEKMGIARLQYWLGRVKVGGETE